MAYVSKEKKAVLVAAVKKVMPADWKATYGVRNHSTFVITINEAPASVIADSISVVTDNHIDVNVYHVDKRFTGKTRETLNAIVAAANTGNHNNSDIMTDYFDVGHYVEIQFGKWDKPCRFIA